MENEFKPKLSVFTTAHINVVYTAVSGAALLLYALFMGEREAGSEIEKAVMLSTGIILIFIGLALFTIVNLLKEKK